MKALTNIETLRDMARMCNDTKCDKCPMHEKRIELEYVDCNEFRRKEPYEAFAILQKWSANHPEKTFLSDFKEKYPNVKLDEAGTPQRLCPHMLGYIEAEIRPCRFETHKCIDCWSRPLEEV